MCMQQFTTLVIFRQSELELTPFKTSFSVQLPMGVEKTLATTCVWVEFIESEWDFHVRAHAAYEHANEQCLRTSTFQRECWEQRIIVGCDSTK